MCSISATENHATPPPNSTNACTQTSGYTPAPGSYQWFGHAPFTYASASPSWNSLTSAHSYALYAPALSDHAAGGRGHYSGPAHTHYATKYAYPTLYTSSFNVSDF